MAGIYVHVPFCRQACHYCDFHFSTNTSRMDEMIEAIMKELEHRTLYVSPTIDTIYLGGGTPSLLPIELTANLLEKISHSYHVNSGAEITLEANPEDLTNEKLADLFSLGINRLSIGAQTFTDDLLRWMNRAHSSDDIKQSFETARMIGFDNISLDVIYSLPSTEPPLEQDLREVIALGPEHISLYGLTIEDRTVFGKWKKTGKLEELPEVVAAEQYLSAIETMGKHGYDQYEVSNFAKRGFESKHNSSYWSGKPYLGVGPGAHSFDGSSRQFNVRNNARYIKAIQSNEPYFESEELSTVQRMNEAILTQLRRIIGIDLKQFYRDFQVNLNEEHERLIGDLVHQGYVEQSDAYIKLTSTGFLVADEIALKLFFDE